VRTHWRERQYWLWIWRQRIPFGAKVTGIVVFLCALLGAGWVTADGLTSTHGSSDAVMLETTVVKLVTVREKGRIVRKAVLVTMQRPRGASSPTQPKYVTVTASASGDATAHTLTRLVPVVAKRQITIDADPRTVTRTRLATTARTRTATVARTVTSSENVTQPAVTVIKPETSTITRTETRVDTITRTQTQAVTQTVTLPAETVTVVDTVTVTVPKPK
jgi:hypothetical protein